MPARRRTHPKTNLSTYFPNPMRHAHERDPTQDARRRNNPNTTRRFHAAQRPPSLLSGRIARFLEDVAERISHVLLGVRPLRLLHRLRAEVGLGVVEPSAAERG